MSALVVGFLARDKTLKILILFFKTIIIFSYSGAMVDNVLKLPEDGYLEALHCQPITNFDRRTKLDFNH